MELEEMKQLWEEMSEQMERQKLLTDKLIMAMTEERYRNKFNTAWVAESAGTVICFGFALLILLNFHKFDAWYLWASAVFTVLYLFLVPIAMLYFLNRMRKLDIAGSDFRQMLLDFNRAKEGFHLVNRVGMAMNFVLMFTITVLSIVIFKGSEAVLERTSWLYMMPFGAMALFLFSRWGYRCYVGMTNSAENLLRDLDPS